MSESQPFPPLLAFCAVWIIGAAFLGAGYGVWLVTQWAIDNTSVAIDLVGWTLAIASVPALAGAVVLAVMVWWYDE